MRFIVNERKGGEEGEKEGWEEEDLTEEDCIFWGAEEVGEVYLREEREEDEEGEGGVDEPGMGEVGVDEGERGESERKKSGGSA